MTTSEELTLEKAKKSLLSIKGVVGVGLTHSSVTGVTEVSKKGYQILVSITDISVINNLPSNVDGIHIVYKIVEKVKAQALAYTNEYFNKFIRNKQITATGNLGQLQALQTLQTDPKQKYRPVMPGVSCGLLNSMVNMTGTLGAFVYDSNNNIVILSNNHVLAWNFESGSFPAEYQGNIGDSTIQPGAVDGGNLSDSIGTLAKSKQITSGTNIVDCAYSIPTTQITEPDICELGSNISVTPQIGLSSRKAGRTTGCTMGVIESINSAFYVDYEITTSQGNVKYSAFFDDLVTISNPSGSPVTQPGDSGSCWVTSSGSYSIGLTFAGDSSGTSIVCKASNIESELGVRFGVYPVSCNEPLLNFGLN